MTVPRPGTPRTPRGTVRAVRGRIADAFANAGVTGSLHAVDIDSGAELDLGADTLVSTASLHKLCLVTTLFREAEVGRIELSRRVELPAEPRAAPAAPASRPCSTRSRCPCATSRRWRSR